jgi:hypothetical protein
LVCLLSISPAALSRGQHSGTCVPHRHLANQAFACPLHIPLLVKERSARAMITSSFSPSNILDPAIPKQFLNYIA